MEINNDRPISNNINLDSENQPINNMNFDSAERPIDKTTSFGQGITYKTCDGKDVATMEEVMQYNQMYYDNMKAHEDGLHK